MNVLKVFKTDIGLVTFVINLLVYSFILSTLYFANIFFSLTGWPFTIAAFILFVIFSFIMVQLNYQFVNTKLLNMCNIISKNNFQEVDKIFPYDIFEVVNIELNFLSGTIKDKLIKEKNQLDYFEKNILKVMEKVDRINYGTKKLTRKMKEAFTTFDNNSKYINVLKEKSNKFRDQLSGVKGEKYNYKIIIDEINNINKKLNNTHKKIDILVSNLFNSKKGEEDNLNLIEDIKIKIKNFYDIIETIDLTAVNASIEAARLEEGQTFLMFAKDLQLSVSKFNKEISDISDILQKFQIKKADMDNFLYIIRELKEEYKNFNLFIDNINDFFDYFKKWEVDNKEVYNDLVTKTDDIDELLKDIDFHSVKVFKTNIEKINENMDALEEIYTYVQDIKHKIITFI